MSSEDERDRDTNLLQRVACPCNQCKWAVQRQRRVVLQHVREYGRFDPNIIDQVVADGDHDDQSHANILQPVRRVRMRPTVHVTTDVNASMAPSSPEVHAMEYPQVESINDSPHSQMPFEEEMDEMVEAIMETTDPVADDVKEEARIALYEGSRISRLKAMLALLNLQTSFGWSDKSVTELFKLLKSQILPPQNTMPSSRDDARKILRKLGMDYNSIHACPNDCILFQKEHAHLERCPKCNADRYRKDVQGDTIPEKVLRHFPLIPRIKHMFRCSSIASLMSWHSQNLSSDGVQRIPADCMAWKHIDERWPDFAKEARNLRLGLAMDGVNPFGLRSTAYSVWQVVVVNYNIPPWMTTKKGHLILSLIVPGRYKVKNMDVYLQPLVDELKELWTGIMVVDKSKRLNR